MPTNQTLELVSQNNETGLDASATEKLGQTDFHNSAVPGENAVDVLVSSSLVDAIQVADGSSNGGNSGFQDGTGGPEVGVDPILGSQEAGVSLDAADYAVAVPVESDSVAPDAPSPSGGWIYRPVLGEMGDNTFRGALFQSVRGLDKRIYTRVSQNGRHWSSWKESGGLTDSRPNIEEFNGKLFQTVRGLGNGIHTRYSSDGVNWTRWEATGGRTLDAPDLKAFKGRLYQTVQGTDNGIYIRSSADGMAWTGWQSSGGAASSGPALEVFNDRLYQTVRGTNNLVYVRSSADGKSWTPWKYTGGATSASPDLEVFKGRLYQG